jgi:hypothetical protein
LIQKFKNLWDNNYWILYGDWLAAPRDISIFNAPKKIVVRQTGDCIIATSIGSKIICRNNLHVLIPRTKISLEYVLALMNSKLMDFVYTTINPEKGEALAEVKKNHIEQLPILNVVENKQKILSCITDYMLYLNELSDENPINEYVPNKHIIQLFEEVIDALVYELYFEEDFRKADIAFMEYAERDFKSIEGKGEDEAKAIIHSAYQKLREKDNEIRQNLKLMDTRLADLIMPIKTAK